jgi:hypothetical protein
MPFAAMQGWEFLIIPAIGFVVWLVGMLFRNATEAPKKDVRRPAREAEEPRRQTSSDLDRFISDTRRQRESEERRGQRPPQAARPQRRPIILEEVVEEPRPRPAVRPPAARAPQAPRPIPPRPLPTRVPAPRPAVPVLDVVETVSIAPVLQALPQNVLPTMPDQPAAPVDMLQREVLAVSPLLLDVKQMLNSPRSAQLAIVLREILDAPLSRRRR